MKNQKSDKIPKPICGVDKIFTARKHRLSLITSLAPSPSLPATINFQCAGNATQVGIGNTIYFKTNPKCKIFKYSDKMS